MGADRLRSTDIPRCGAGAIHVGIRDVVLDCLQPMIVRVPFMAIVGFGLLAMEAWITRIPLVL